MIKCVHSGYLNKANNRKKKEEKTGCKKRLPDLVFLCFELKQKKNRTKKKKENGRRTKNTFISGPPKYPLFYVFLA